MILAHFEGGEEWRNEEFTEAEIIAALNLAKRV
jgi:hypothetical protein